MPKPKAILYDYDGMLARGERFSDKYSAEFGIDSVIMNPFFTGAFHECLLGKADLKEELAKVVEEWKWRGTIDELLVYWFATGELVPEVFDSIEKLKEQGVVVCLATNQEKYRITYLTRKHNFDIVFDEIFCCANLNAFKHSDEGLEKIFQILKVKHGIQDKKEIMYWDDRPGNVENLINAGFNGQLYKDFPAFKQTLSEYGLSL